MRKPRRALALTTVAFAVAVAIGGPLPDVLTFSRAFDDPGSEASEARNLVERSTGAAFAGGIVALVDAPPGSGRVARTAAALREESSVAQVTVPSVQADSPLVSADGRQTLVTASLRADAVPETAVEGIVDRFHGVPGVLLGGSDVTRAQLTEQASQDLTRAELLAFPILAVLSLLIFRGIAALLPLIVGGLTIPRHLHAPTWCE